jgi:hypothetical protein
MKQDFAMPRRARLGAILGAIGAVTLLSACVTPPPAPTPAADMPGKVVKYTCTGGSHLSVTYGNGTAMLPGPENLLLEEGAAGKRYSWPSDGTHHVWVLDANGTGTLLMKDGTKGGAESVVKSGCKADA